MILAATLLPTLAHAQERPEVTFGVFLDAYYSYNFNQPRPVAVPSTASVGSAALPPANNTYRYYDAYHNQMTLSLAELTVQAKHGDVTGLIDLDFGPFADLNSQSPYPSSAVVDESTKHIGQAFISYHPKDSRYYFDAGKMYAHLGVEAVKSKDNFNYSRSILFSFAMPFWATGVRFGYDVVPEKLQSSFYVYNGWSSMNDVNESKTVGLQIKANPSGTLGLSYNFLGGPERPGTESDWRIVHEVNVTYNASGTISVITDLIYGSEENVPVGTNRARAQWYGGLVGARFQVNRSSYLSPRYEIYRDNDGYTLGGAPQTIQSATLACGRELSKVLDLRVEARSDFSNESSFAGKNGTQKSQSTLLGALLFKI